MIQKGKYKKPLCTLVLILLEQKMLVTSTYSEDNDMSGEDINWDDVPRYDDISGEGINWLD